MKDNERNRDGDNPVSVAMQLQPPLQGNINTPWKNVIITLNSLSLPSIQITDKNFFDISTRHLFHFIHLKQGHREKEQEQYLFKITVVHLCDKISHGLLLLGGRGKGDGKRDMRRGTSPLPGTNSMTSSGAVMSGKGPMMMGGNPGMMNMGTHSMGPPGQRHPQASLQPPGMPMSRTNQQNLNLRGEITDIFLRSHLLLHLYWHWFVHKLSAWGSGHPLLP